MNNITVMYKKREVGILAYKDDQYYFQYSDSWLENGFSISPFSLPLVKKLFKAEKEPFNGLFGVFQDSLPDAWGQLLFERYLNKNGLIIHNQIERLSMIGNSGMGGLEYKPSMNQDIMDIPFDFEKYQSEASKLLSEKECDDVDYLYKYGSSSGGARPKALVSLDGKSYIVKFQSKYDIKDSGKMEYDYMNACESSGIHVPSHKLISDTYFAVERFDRKDGKKVHMISAAALLEADFRSPCLDYTELFKLVRIITKNRKEDITELFKRMCFNVHAHNLDDHAKNFSFLYDEDLKRYVLSPAYDMTYSNTYYNEHMTSVNHKGINITDSDLYFCGKTAGLSMKEMEEMNEKVKSVVSAKLSKYMKS